MVPLSGGVLYSGSLKKLSLILFNLVLSEGIIRTWDEQTNNSYNYLWLYWKWGIPCENASERVFLRERLRWRVDLRKSTPVDAFMQALQKSSKVSPVCIATSLSAPGKPLIATRSSLTGETHKLTLSRWEANPAIAIRRKNISRGISKWHDISLEQRFIVFSLEISRTKNQTRRRHN